MRQFTGFLGVFADFYASAFSAPAGVDLGFHDDAATQLRSRLFRIFNVERHLAARHGNAVPGKESLGLIFVDLHCVNWVLDLSREAFGAAVLS